MKKCPAMTQQIRDMSNVQKILVLLLFIIYFLFVPESVLDNDISEEKKMLSDLKHLINNLREFLCLNKDVMRIISDQTFICHGICIENSSIYCMRLLYFVIISKRHVKNEKK